MLQDKDLFDLFRKNQYNLNEVPSPNTWKRIERKLDDRRHQHLTGFRRILGMVAGLALIIVSVVLLTIPSVEPAANVAPKTWEDLPKSDQNTHGRLVDLSLQFQNSIHKPIVESPVKRKILNVKR